MNFYKNICDWLLYNKTHIANNITRYIRFMNTSNSSFFPYINYENDQHNIINSFN